MGWLSVVIGLGLVLETESVHLWRSLPKWRYGNENTFIQVSCGAFYGCFPQARSQAFHFSLRVLNPFALKLLKLELKDSAYFPKRPLHHRWQGTNKASGIWVLLLTRDCNRSFRRSLMFLSEFVCDLKSEWFWDFLKSLSLKLHSCKVVKNQREISRQSVRNFWQIFNGHFH